MAGKMARLVADQPTDCDSATEIAKRFTLDAGLFL